MARISFRSTWRRKGSRQRMRKEAPRRQQSARLEHLLFGLKRIIMLVVMHSHATPGEVAAVVKAIQDMSLTAHPMPGPTRTAIGITGNVGTVDPRTLEVLPGVMELIRVTKPYKLASREMHEADTYVRLPQGTIGPGTFTLIAGPCSVENEAMIVRTAEFL